MDPPAAPNLMFDALVGGQAPAAALGDRAQGEVVAARFQAVTAQAQAALGSFFQLGAEAGAPLVRALDDLVARLWASGWNAEERPLALYTLHLGALLMTAVLAQGGEAVFRSERDLTHASVWFAARRVELFPFHKAYRVLTRPGERLMEMFELAGGLTR